MKRPSVVEPHREDIKAAIRRTGITCEDLAMRHGYCRSAIRRALQRPWPAVETIIARYLGVQPEVLWPSRYDPSSGLPLRGLHAVAGRDNAGNRSAPASQKKVAR